MNTFDQEFFDELSKFNSSVWYDAQKDLKDGFEVGLTLSELRKAGRIGDVLVDRTAKFAEILAKRSDGKYLFRRDFRVSPEQTYSFSRGRVGRMQFHVRFNSIKSNRFGYTEWGVSIGLGAEFYWGNRFDIWAILYRNCGLNLKASPMNDLDCANYDLGSIDLDSDFLDQFDPFGDLIYELDEYLESAKPFVGCPIISPGNRNNLQSPFLASLFFGYRLSLDTILSFGTMENFVDKCIRTFDALDKRTYPEKEGSDVCSDELNEGRHSTGWIKLDLLGKPKTRRIALNIESTGNDSKQGHRIVEISAIELVGCQELGDIFHYYINPQRKIDVSVAAVHGLTNELLYDKAIFSEIAGSFLEFIADAELIIHNAPSSIRILNYELELLDLFELENHIVDTLQVAQARSCGKNTGLAALCKHYDIDESRLEFKGGLLNAEMVAKVYLAMAREQEQGRLGIQSAHFDSNEDYGCGDSGQHFD